MPNPVAKNLFYKTRPLAGGLSSNAMGLTTKIRLQLHKDWVTSTGAAQPKLKLPAKNHTREPQKLKINGHQRTDRAKQIAPAVNRFSTGAWMPTQRALTDQTLVADANQNLTFTLTESHRVNKIAIQVLH